MKTQVSIIFSLTGFVNDLDCITNDLGINPTEIRYKETYKVKEYARDSWQWSIDYKTALNISDIFEKLVEKFAGKEKLICEIKEKYNLVSTIELVVKIYEHKSPVFIFTDKCIQFAAKTNSEIHTDNYYYCDCEFD